MTREEEIIQAAQIEYGGENLVTLAFKKGAEWADQHPQSPWISVEDRLPKINETVLWCDIDGEYRLGWLQEDEYIFLPLKEHRTIVENMQYWMLIPELKEGGEK